MAIRRERIVIAVLAVLALVLVVAWIDGGREPQRQIEQPVELPEGGQ